MEPEASSRELRNVALAGARWTALARVVAESATFATAIALARLVDPAGFGHAAVALIVVSMAAVLGTAGLVSPLVQRRELDAHHLSSATFLVLGAGCLLAASTAAFGEYLAPAIFAPETSDLIVLASSAWIVVALGATSQAVLQRALEFRTLAAIESAAAVVAGIASLLAAAAGLQGGALVLGGLALLASTSVLSILASRPPAPRPTRAGLSDLYRFGLTTTASSLVYLAYRNVDYAILGARANPVEVGYYWRAYQLGVGYQAKITRVMLRISLPIYSRATSLEELRDLRARIVRTHATVLIPLLGTFIGVAPTLIPWLFGSSWEPAVLPAQIMALAGMADAVTTGLGPLMVALGRPRELLVWNLVQLAAFVVVVYALSAHGTTALAIGVAAFGIFNVVAIQLGLLRRYVGLALRQLWLDVRAGVVAGLVALVTTTGTRLALDGRDIPTVITLVLLGVVALATIWLVLRLAFPDEEADVRRIVSRRH